ncbi:sedoheptulose-1,7-bisphosphatase [Pleomassaria siparia CBS 279.74]|uniref:Sedoheptulose-1,7-bisphosphatase n=1 Tax=Pleomassaria siparia CBS 279.74 TaxID=1314801 RepID=A0A6G1KD55_9PLEO|nr:sedoheptulose-1,7-bisphosphatase [Pleomassaria siparia CBS 279.74]
MANKRGVGVDLTAHLETLLPPGTRTSLVQEVIPKLIASFTTIAHALRSAQTVSQVGTANAFGDDQLNVDVMAEEILRTAISQIPSIFTASSEEDPVERSTGSTADVAEKYTVAFDPLDGSSIIAPNWTVGTIIGIWDGETALKKSGKNQVAAVLGVYGPRTTAVVALRVPGCKEACFEVGIGEGSGASSSSSSSSSSPPHMEIVNPRIQLQSAPFKTRYFAPANMRAAGEDDKYMKLLTHFITERYTLRYIGGLVPDIVHALVKGHGVYVSPVTGNSKAKLRRLYELAPIALVVECAGGSAIDAADGKSILEREIGDTDERAGLICGTTEEVEFVHKTLLG